MNELNPYQRKLLRWKGERVEVTFINGEKIDGRVADVDVWRNKFLIKTDYGEVLVLGGVALIKKNNDNEEEVLWRD